MNRRIFLAQRPVGQLTADWFRLEKAPTPKPGEGEVLLRARYLWILGGICGREMITSAQCWR